MKALLFDFWGTLVEQGVRSPLAQAQEILDLRLPFSEYVVRMEKAMMTKPFAELKEAFAAVCQEFGNTCSDEQLEQLVGLWNKSWMLAQPYEETLEVLQELKQRYRLILVSNTDNISVTRVLEKFQLSALFERKFLSFEVGLLKTDRSFFNQILDEVNLAMEDCIMVGDSMESDIMPAKKIGMKAVLIDRRNKRDFSPKVVNLRELEPLIEQVL
ncbi:MAG: HAD family hydrolase [Nanoarchaeota archaeon]